MSSDKTAAPSCASPAAEVDLPAFSTHDGNRAIIDLHHAGVQAQGATKSQDTAQDRSDKIGMQIGSALSFE